MTKVKICGLKRPQDALAAVEAGADFLGFVFAPSRRQLSSEVVRDIVSEVHGVNTKIVGVFVNELPDEMNRVAKQVGLDYVQLHGDEPGDLAAVLNVPAIQAIRVDSSMSEEEIKERADGSTAEILLLDAANGNGYGGTGNRLDWHRLPALERPVLLAGGLDSSNVQEAIRLVRPWGVDVSSGVETDSEKDPLKIEEFVNAARG